MEYVDNIHKTLVTGHSPMVDEWPLMGSPYPVAVILAAYLYFVLRGGPRMMQNRKPMDLKLILLVYNAVQVVYSVFICVLVRIRSLVANCSGDSVEGFSG